MNKPSYTIEEQRKKAGLFVILSGFFIVNAIVAEFIGAKIFSLEATLGFKPFTFNFFGSPTSLNLTAGVLLWPVVFVMTDIINEYYGHKGVKRLSYFAVGLILYAFAMVYIAMKTTPATWWTVSKSSAGIADFGLAFNSVFGQGLNIIIGSVVAFIIGQLVDVSVFHRIRKISNEKMLWLRATGSTLVSQLIDSFVVLFLAFYLLQPYEQKMPLNLLFAIMMTNYIYKFFMALVLTPILYGVHNIIDSYLGKELSHKMMEEAKRK